MEPWWRTRGGRDAAKGGAVERRSHDEEREVAETPQRERQQRGEAVETLQRKGPRSNGVAAKEKRWWRYHRGRDRGGERWWRRRKGRGRGGGEATAEGDAMERQMALELWSRGTEEGAAEGERQPWSYGAVA
ncbi:hypothetical protein COCNU_10G008870 [Cocos nucifera]|uniref:Uncharacterized protein n=1 Tax=Cocos nucifera TaxID=13894 RepID=A0A8K0IMM6_COCNU|nr:hypothetical protein COCNU_10G008870 [Cocos nucifera]